MKTNRKVSFSSLAAKVNNLSNQEEGEACDEGTKQTSLNNT